MITPTIHRHNENKIDSFGYGVQLIKNGTGRVIDVGSMVTMFDIYESVSTMAMSMTVGFVDASNAFVKYGFQPGDQLRVLLFNDEGDKKRIDVTMPIMTFSDINRIENTKGRTFTAYATDKSAMLNKKGTVLSAFEDSPTNIIKIVSQKFLGIDPKKLTVESTTGSLKYIPTNTVPYNVISSLCSQSLSSEYGAGQSFYFFQNADGFFFRSLKGIIESAKTANSVWNYTLSVTSNMTGVAGGDFYRIIDYVHHSTGNQPSRMGGLFESGLIQFNHLNRSITISNFKYKDNYKQIQTLSTNPVVDLNNNYDDWTTDVEHSVPGTQSFVVVRSNPEAYGIIDSYANNFHQALSQTMLFRQNMYFLHINGNARLRAGDLMKITAKEISAATNPDPDELMSGTYLILNVRHSMQAGEVFRTTLDITTDGPIHNIYTEKNTGVI